MTVFILRKDENNEFEIWKYYIFPIYIVLCTVISYGVKIRDKLSAKYLSLRIYLELYNTHVNMTMHWITCIFF